MFKKLIKPNGISVLIAAQNEEKTIKMSVESFLDFADEIIIVTNGSTDNTPNICKFLECEYSKVKYFNKPELSDLYHNRAFALSKAKYRWIAKFDSDFIAYDDDDGELSISHLRKNILNSSPYWPTLFNLELINIYRTIHECGIDNSKRIKKNDKYEGHYVPQIYTKMAKIFLNSPLLAFKRIGRWEHVPYLKFYLRKYHKSPAFFHLTLKSDENLFVRSERTNWRELGDFDKYPTLESYIEQYVLPIKYQSSKEKAVKKYIESEVMPYLTRYDESEHYPYPKRIKDQIENGFFE